MEIFERWRTGATKSAQSLTLRIVSAMLCVVTLAVITYAAAMFYGISLAEEVLIGRDLEEKLQKVAEHRGFAADDETETVYTTATGTDFPPVPKRYLTMKEGFSESLGDEDYFIFKQKRGNEIWVIEKSQMEFEEEEMELYLRLLIGFVIIFLFTGLTGLWLASAVTRPVKRLANEVRGMARQTTFQPLSERPADDEIGELALTVEDTLKKFNEVLDRERAFTADVSHELRTPLMVISSTTELLRLPASSEEKEKRLQRIEGACRRLNRLVRVFLELARGSEESTAEIVSWDSVVRVAVANWQPEAKKAGLRLSWGKTDESQVMVNGAFAESVLDNLLRNALQYTVSGTIDVRLSADAVSVADTGRGIEDGEKESILHAFVRGETAPGEGYGWGLSLVRRICRKQGWRLEFRRNEPCGTVFTVRFGSENAF